MLVLGRSAGQSIVIPGYLEARISVVAERKAFVRFKVGPSREPLHRWMKQGDSLEFCDGKIEFYIVRAHRGTASIGVLADQSIKVLRGELV